MTQGKGSADDQLLLCTLLTRDITNGYDLEARPSALYLAANIDSSHPERSAWVELAYGVGGNVTSMTVYAQCDDAPMETCTDPGPSDHASRSETPRETCTCCVTQQYEYRRDELNRISEARRFDRAGTSDWAPTSPDVHLVGEAVAATQ